MRDDVSVTEPSVIEKSPNGGGNVLMLMPHTSASRYASVSPAPSVAASAASGVRSMRRETSVRSIAKPVAAASATPASAATGTGTRPSSAQATKRPSAPISP